LWKNGATGSSITVNQQGKYWVQVTENGCSSTDTIMVYTIAPQSVHLGNDTLLCQGSVLTLNAYKPGASYLWQNGNTNPTFIVTNEGRYSVTVSKGICKVKDSIYVFYAAKPHLDLGHDTGYCFNVPVLLDASQSYADSFLWQNGSSSSMFVAGQAGLYWVQIKKLVCIVRDSVLLTQKAFPIVNLGPDKKICKEESVLLDAGNTGSSFLWNDDSTVQARSVKAPGRFSVKVTNTLGCIRSDSILLDTFPSPSVSLGNDRVICEGSTLELNPTGTFQSYRWQDGSTGTFFVADSAGVYFVHVRDGNNCSAADTIQLTLRCKPDVYLAGELHLCEPDILIKPTGDFVSCVWQDGTTSASYRVTDYGKYSVTVTDAYNCSNEAAVEVISNCPGRLFIPNAFTPNNDGNNEIFYPVVKEVIAYHLEIYNRWGQMVFVSDDTGNGWNGKYQDAYAQPDVYTYVIRYTGLDKVPKVQSGNVTLLK
jgi:gliding motility-associated-like protein